MISPHRPMATIHNVGRFGGFPISAYTSPAISSWSAGAIRLERIDPATFLRTLNGHHPPKSIPVLREFAVAAISTFFNTIRGEADMPSPGQCLQMDRVFTPSRPNSDTRSQQLQFVERVLGVSAREPGIMA